MVEKRAEKIAVDIVRCKGCNICVEFCPKKVLELREGKAFVVRLNQCNACMLCEMRCPDFAISVFVSTARREEAA